MFKIQKTTLVTCALPYSNGPIHLGHMLEHIQADIWVRYMRMCGEKVVFVCADDAHGTAIMLKSREIGISPDEMIKKINEYHKKDFFDFSISYDNYYSTHSFENKVLLERIYKILCINGFIVRKTILQFYDTKKFMFLPDRFVKGTCPVCFSKNQCGDNCEICGVTYNAMDLINPCSSISGTSPVLKKTKHLFFDLPKFSSMLKTWIYSGVLDKHVCNKINEWFSLGLRMWDITRNEPYFGFKIPNEKNKYFYVWLDAIVGYIGSFQNFYKKKYDVDFLCLWKKNLLWNLYHFIGKDIIYFHSLLWPAILEIIGCNKPKKIFVHGYVTVNGLKMSKSRETFITARSYLNNFDSDCLRYYYASKLSSKIVDVDFNLNDFVSKVNRDIVNKIVNLAARNASFINNLFFNTLSSNVENSILYNKFVDVAFDIKNKFYNREYYEIIQDVVFLANLANKYIDEHEPWFLKSQKYSNKLHNICSMGINFFRIIITCLKPILPNLSKKSESFLNVLLKWDEIKFPLLNHKISKFNILFCRIQKDNVKFMISDSKKSFLF